MGKTSIDVEVCSNCGPLQRLGSWLCNCRGGNHEAVPFVPASELAAAQGALRVACYKWKTIAPEDDNRTVDQLILWCIAAHARAEASPPATADGMERLLNAEVQFGLVAQGHIPEIEAMLAEGQDWNEIGAVICWHAGTAKQHYERYLEASKEANSPATNDAEPKADGVPKQCGECNECRLVEGVFRCHGIGKTTHPAIQPDAISPGPPPVECPKRPPLATPDGSRGDE